MTILDDPGLDAATLAALDRVRAVFATSRIAEVSALDDFWDGPNPDFAVFSFRELLPGGVGHILRVRGFRERDWLRDRNGRFLKFVGMLPKGKRKPNWGTDADGNEVSNFQVTKVFDHEDSDRVVAYGRPVVALNNQQEVVIEVGDSVRHLGRGEDPTAEEIANLPFGMPTDLAPDETRYVRIKPKQLEIVSDPMTKSGGRAALPDRAEDAVSLGANAPDDEIGDNVDDLDPIEARALEDEIRAAADEAEAAGRAGEASVLRESADLIGGAQQSSDPEVQDRSLDDAEAALREGAAALPEDDPNRARIEALADRTDGLLLKQERVPEPYAPWQEPEQGTRGTGSDDAFEADMERQGLSGRRRTAARAERAENQADFERVTGRERRKAQMLPMSQRAKREQAIRALDGVAEARDLVDRQMLDPRVARRMDAMATAIEDGRAPFSAELAPHLRRLAERLRPDPDQRTADDDLADVATEAVARLKPSSRLRQSTDEINNAIRGLANEPGIERRRQLVNALENARAGQADDVQEFIDSAVADVDLEEPEVAPQRRAGLPEAERRAVLPGATPTVVAGEEEGVPGGTGEAGAPEGEVEPPEGAGAKFVPPDAARQRTVRQSLRDAAGDGGLWSDGGRGAEDESAEPGLTGRTLRISEEGAAGFKELHGRDSRAFNELTQTPEAAQRFHEAITAAKASNRMGPMVTAYEPDEYAAENTRLFLAEDGLSGFALRDGDIISVFSHADAPKGALDEIMPMAIQEGGNRLDAFDGGLGKLYGRYGFKASARMPFNPDYKPDGWDDELHGAPDVIFMHLDPSGATGTYTPGDGDYVDAYDDGLRRARVDAGLEALGRTAAEPTEGVAGAEATPTPTPTPETPAAPEPFGSADEAFRVPNLPDELRDVSRSGDAVATATQVNDALQELDAPYPLDSPRALQAEIQRRADLLDDAANNFLDPDGVRGVAQQMRDHAARVGVMADRIEAEDAARRAAERTPTPTPAPTTGLNPILREIAKNALPDGWEDIGVSSTEPWVKRYRTPDGRTVVLGKDYWEAGAGPRQAKRKGQWVDEKHLARGGVRRDNPVDAAEAGARADLEPPLPRGPRVIREGPQLGHRGSHRMIPGERYFVGSDPGEDGFSAVAPIDPRIARRNARNQYYLDNNKNLVVGTPSADGGMKWTAYDKDGQSLGEYDSREAAVRATKPAAVPEVTPEPELTPEALAEADRAFMQDRLGPLGALAPNVWDEFMRNARFAKGPDATPEEVLDAARGYMRDWAVDQGDEDLLAAMDDWILGDRLGDEFNGADEDTKDEWRTALQAARNTLGDDASETALIDEARAYVEPEEAVGPTAPEGWTVEPLTDAQKARERADYRISPPEDSDDPEVWANAEGEYWTHQVPGRFGSAQEAIDAFNAEAARDEEVRRQAEEERRAEAIAEAQAAQAARPAPPTQVEALRIADEAGAGDAVKDAILTGDPEKVREALAEDPVLGDRFFDWDSRGDVDMPRPEQRAQWERDGAIFDAMLNAQPVEPVAPATPSRPGASDVDAAERAAESYLNDLLGTDRGDLAQLINGPLTDAANAREAGNRDAEADARFRLANGLDAIADQVSAPEGERLRRIADRLRARPVQSDIHEAELDANGLYQDILDVGEYDLAHRVHGPLADLYRAHNEGDSEGAAGAANDLADALDEVADSLSPEMAERARALAARLRASGAESEATPAMGIPASGRDIDEDRRSDLDLDHPVWSGTDNGVYQEIRPSRAEQGVHVLVENTTDGQQRVREFPSEDDARAAIGLRRRGRAPSPQPEEGQRPAEEQVPDAAQASSNLDDAIEEAGDAGTLPEVDNAVNAVGRVTDEAGNVTGDSRELSDTAEALDDAAIAIDDSGDASEGAQNLTGALEDAADAMEEAADNAAAAEAGTPEAPPRVPLGQMSDMTSGRNPNRFIEGSDQEQISMATELIDERSDGASRRHNEAVQRYNEALANGDEDAAARAMADVQQALSDWAAAAESLGHVAEARKARAQSRRIGTALRKAGYPATRIDRRNQPKARERRRLAEERRQERAYRAEQRRAERAEQRRVAREQREAERQRRREARGQAGEVPPSGTPPGEGQPEGEVTPPVGGPEGEAPTAPKTLTEKPAGVVNDEEWAMDLIRRKLAGGPDEPSDEEVDRAFALLQGKSKTPETPAPVVDRSKDRSMDPADAPAAASQAADSDRAVTNYLGMEVQDQANGLVAAMDAVKEKILAWKNGRGDFKETAKTAADVARRDPRAGIKAREGIVNRVGAREKYALELALQTQDPELRAELVEIARRAKALRQTLERELKTEGGEKGIAFRKEMVERWGKVRELMGRSPIGGGARRWTYMDDYSDEVDYSVEEAELRDIANQLSQIRRGGQWNESYAAAERLLNNAYTDLSRMVSGDLSRGVNFQREEALERVINALNRADFIAGDEDNRAAGLRDRLLAVRRRAHPQDVDTSGWDLPDGEIRAAEDSLLQFMGKGSELGEMMIVAQKALKDARMAPAGSDERWAALMRARNAMDLAHVRESIPIMDALGVRVEDGRLRDMDDPTFTLNENNIAPRRPAPRGQDWDSTELDDLNQMAAEIRQMQGTQLQGQQRARTARLIEAATGAYLGERYGEFEAFYDMALQSAMAGGLPDVLDRMIASRLKHQAGIDPVRLKADLDEAKGLAETLPKKGPRGPAKSSSQRRRENARGLIKQAAMETNPERARVLLSSALWQLRQANSSEDSELREILSPYDPNGDVRPQNFDDPDTPDLPSPAEPPTTPGVPTSPFLDIVRMAQSGEPITNGKIQALLPDLTSDQIHALLQELEDQRLLYRLTAGRNRSYGINNRFTNSSPQELADAIQRAAATVAPGQVARPRNLPATPAGNGTLASSPPVSTELIDTATDPSAIEAKIKDILRGYGDDPQKARAERGGALADAAVLEMAGMLNPPMVVSTDEFDAIQGLGVKRKMVSSDPEWGSSSSGGLVTRDTFYRGMRPIDGQKTIEEIAAKFMYDEPDQAYVGWGVLGNGIYFGSEMNAFSFSGTSSGPTGYQILNSQLTARTVLLRIKLKPDTRLVQWEDIPIDVRNRYAGSKSTAIYQWVLDNGYHGINGQMQANDPLVGINLLDRSQMIIEALPVDPRKRRNP